MGHGQNWCTILGKGFPFGTQPRWYSGSDGECVIDWTLVRGERHNGKSQVWNSGGESHCFSVMKGIPGSLTLMLGISSAKCLGVEASSLPFLHGHLTYMITTS